MLLEKIELEPSETIQKVVRVHWFVIVSQLVSTAFIMVALPGLITLLFNYSMLQSSLGDLSRFNYLLSYILILWLLGNLILIFTIWTHYYLDLWVITNQRIIVINQVGFFNRKVSSFRLERLQDISVAISGIIPTFLDFGTLHAHTAGNKEENFTTANLPSPRDLQALIQKSTDERLRQIGKEVITTNNI